ncbi:radical SAM protein [Ignatzschineria larvae DSM 13226]|uniref:Radical SAM protein n=1 Tax=Ignatzschineria larvae DSM 13226 TaxID=1111732 RepID=A0ABZ3BYV8_9GAMM|nr:radical SAM protein [Ignatzschineria larvae]
MVNLKLPYWVTKTEKGHQLILFNWWNNFSVQIYDKYHPAYQYINQNSIGYKTDKYIDDINWLINNKFIIESTDDPIIIKEEKFNSEILHLILLPAGEACNLDCVYCYEDHDDKSRMTIEHADILLKMILKLNKKHVHIEYFGGEPLLNINFISYFSNLMSNKNISYSISITTNGTLLNESTFNTLYSSNVKSYQITLDGLEDKHNELRVSKSKNINSFKSVVRAIETLKNSNKNDIRVVLRLNVNESTIDDGYLTIFGNFIKNLVPSDDPRFLILPKPISDYSHLNLKDNVSAQTSYCKASNTVIRKIEEYLIKNNLLSASSFLATNNSGYCCYAGNENSLVITPDFSIRKCTVAMNDPINIVGNVLPNGSIIKNNNFPMWTKDYSDSNCKSCFLQKSCQGNSCPLANIKNSKKICPPLKSDVSFLTEQVMNYYEK